MGDVNRLIAQHQNGIVCQNREIQNHLVYLGVTVAAHTQQLVANAVEHRDDVLWLIAFGKIVARAMVQQIAEQYNAVGLVFLDAVDQPATVIRRTMDIRCDQYFFHNAKLLS